MLRRFLTLLLLLAVIWYTPLARAQEEKPANVTERPTDSPIGNLFGTPADEEAAEEADSKAPFRDLIRERFHKRMEKTNGGPINNAEIAGLSISYWLPPVVPGEDGATTHPLVIFSHGFHGCKTQSIFLMKALAQAGYIVVAPDHQDSSCWTGANGMDRPEVRFGDYALWTDKTYADRATDIKNLYAALKADPTWNKRIDWDKVALAGHSLGGYTVLGLAGGWKAWKMEGIKAVLALSPYVEPLSDHGDLAQITVPVMYQGGTRDFGITPSVKKKGGAYEKTPEAMFIEFVSCGHFGWTDLETSAHQRIIDYSIWFLDRTLKNGDKEIWQDKGVAFLWAK